MRSSGSKSIKVTDDHLNSTIVFVYPSNFKMNSSKVGFGYCGFDSSITAVIPKHEIIRSTEVNRIKKTHLLNWNSSQKIPTGKAAVIKPLPGNKKTLDELKPKTSELDLFLAVTTMSLIDRSCPAKKTFSQK